MQTVSSFYTKYDPAKTVPEQLVRKSSSETAINGRTTYRYLLVGTKLFLISSKIMTIGIQIQDNKQVITNEKKFYIKDVNTEDYYGQFNEKTIDIFVKETFDKYSPSDNVKT